MANALDLADIALILDVSKPTASLLRNGKYATVAGNSRLPERYRRLRELADRAAEPDPEALCLSCPRQDCTGCRVAELI
jgi:hypothetical protein